MMKLYKKISSDYISSILSGLNASDKLHKITYDIILKLCLLQTNQFELVDTRSDFFVYKRGIDDNLVRYATKIQIGTTYVIRDLYTGMYLYISEGSTWNPERYKVLITFSSDYDKTKNIWRQKNILGTAYCNRYLTKGETNAGKKRPPEYEKEFFYAIGFIEFGQDTRSPSFDIEINFIYLNNSFSFIMLDSGNREAVNDTVYFIYDTSKCYNSKEKDIIAINGYSGAYFDTQPATKSINRLPYNNNYNVMYMYTKADLPSGAEGSWYSNWEALPDLQNGYDEPKKREVGAYLIYTDEDLPPLIDEYNWYTTHATDRYSHSDKYYVDYYINRIRGFDYVNNKYYDNYPHKVEYEDVYSKIIRPCASTFQTLEKYTLTQDNIIIDNNFRLPTYESMAIIHKYTDRIVYNGYLYKDKLSGTNYYSGLRTTLDNSAIALPMIYYISRHSQYTQTFSPVKESDFIYIIDVSSIGNGDIVEYIDNHGEKIKLKCFYWFSGAKMDAKTKLIGFGFRLKESEI